MLAGNFCLVLLSLVSAVSFWLNLVCGSQSNDWNMTRFINVFHLGNKVGVLVYMRTCIRGVKPPRKVQDTASRSETHYQKQVTHSLQGQWHISKASYTFPDMKHVPSRPNIFPSPIDPKVNDAFPKANGTFVKSNGTFPTLTERIVPFYSNQRIRKSINWRLAPCGETVSYVEWPISVPKFVSCSMKSLWCIVCTLPVSC